MNIITGDIFCNGIDIIIPIYDNEFKCWRIINSNFNLIKEDKSMLSLEYFIEKNNYKHQNKNIFPIFLVQKQQTEIDIKQERKTWGFKKYD